MSVIASKSPEDMMRSVNGWLIPQLRDCSVGLQFVEPVALPKLEVINALRLTSITLKNGEDDFFNVTMEDAIAWQNRLKCDECNQQLMKGPEQDVYLCNYPLCSMSGRKIYKARGRGVKRLLFQPDFVARTETKQWDCGAGTDNVFDIGNEKIVTRAQKFLSRVVVLMDRRYSDSVLAAVYRSCGTIGEIEGWQLKN